MSDKRIHIEFEVDSSQLDQMNKIITQLDNFNKKIDNFNSKINEAAKVNKNFAETLKKLEDFEKKLGDQTEETNRKRKKGSDQTKKYANETELLTDKTNKLVSTLSNASDTHKKLEQSLDRTSVASKKVSDFLGKQAYDIKMTADSAGNLQGKYKLLDGSTASFTAKLKDATGTIEDFNSKVAVSANNMSKMQKEAMQMSKLAENISKGFKINDINPQIDMGKWNAQSQSLIQGARVVRGSVDDMTGAFRQSVLIQTESGMRVRELTGHYDRLSGQISKTKDVTRVATATEMAQAGVRQGVLETMGLMTDSMKGLNKYTLSFAESMTIAGARMIQWQLAATAIFGTQRAIQYVLSTIVELDTQMVALNRVLDDTVNKDVLFENSVINANLLGQKLTEINNAMIEFGRQGFEQQDVTLLTKYTGMLSNVADVDMAYAAENVASYLATFREGVTGVVGYVDMLNQVDNDFSVSSKQLADSIRVSGATANTFGTSIENLIGLTTAVGESTRESGNVIGRSWKTILSRITTLDKAAEALDAVGVSTKTANGEIRRTDDILAELAGKWDTLTESQKQKTAVDVAGREHLNRFVAAMQNYDRAIAASETASKSWGSAQKENEKYMESLQARINKFWTAAQQMAKTLGDNGLGAAMAFVIDRSTELVLGITNIIDTLGAAGNAIPVVITAASLMGFAFQSTKRNADILQISMNSVGRASALMAGQLGASSAMATTLGLTVTRVTGQIKAMTVALMTNPFFLIAAGITAVVSVSGQLKEAENHLKELSNTAGEAGQRFSEFQDKVREGTVTDYDIGEFEEKLGMVDELYQNVTKSVEGYQKATSNRGYAVVSEENIKAISVLDQEMQDNLATVGIAIDKNTSMVDVQEQLGKAQVNMTAWTKEGSKALEESSKTINGATNDFYDLESSVEASNEELETLIENVLGVSKSILEANAEELRTIDMLQGMKNRTQEQTDFMNQLIAKQAERFGIAQEDMTNKQVEEGIKREEKMLEEMDIRSKFTAGEITEQEMLNQLRTAGIDNYTAKLGEQTKKEKEALDQAHAKADEIANLMSNLPLDYTTKWKIQAEVNEGDFESAKRLIADAAEQSKGSMDFFANGSKKAIEEFNKAYESGGRNAVEQGKLISDASSVTTQEQMADQLDLSKSLGMTQQTFGNTTNKNVGSMNTQASTSSSMSTTTQTAMSNVSKATETASGNVKGNMETMSTDTLGTQKVMTDLPGNVSSVYASSQGQMKSSSAQMSQGVVDGFREKYNTLANKVNDILKSLGVSMRVITWGGSTAKTSNKAARVKGQFALGTSGHPGGLALVGERGRELAHIPNQGSIMVGQSGPEIIDLPVGTSVLPNNKTEKVLANGMLPAYESGVGDFMSDAFDWFMSPKEKIGDFVSDLGDSMSLNGGMKGIAQGSLSKTGDGMVEYFESKVADIFGNFTGAGSEMAQKAIMMALKITGQSLSWVPAMMKIAQHESGFNPRAINLWDINAQRGIPSKGMFQTIDPTFNAYKMNGMNDIYNPVHNAVAAIRYMMSRYGGIGGHPGIRSMAGGGGYKPYANGGIITSAHMGLVGEAGPEAIIPLSPGKRSQGVDMLTKAASMMKIPAYANGTGTTTTKVKPVDYEARIAEFESNMSYFEQIGLIVKGTATQLNMLAAKNYGYSKLGTEGQRDYNLQVIESLKELNDVKVAEKFFKEAKVFGNSTQIRAMWTDVFESVSENARQVAQDYYEQGKSNISYKQQLGLMDDKAFARYMTTPTMRSKVEASGEDAKRDYNLSVIESLSNFDNIGSARDFFEKADLFLSHPEKVQVWRNITKEISDKIIPKAVDGANEFVESFNKGFKEANEEVENFQSNVISALNRLKQAQQDAFVDNYSESFLESIGLSFNTDEGLSDLEKLEKRAEEVKDTINDLLNESGSIEFGESAINDRLGYLSTQKTQLEAEVERIREELKGQGITNSTLVGQAIQPVRDRIAEITAEYNELMSNLQQGGNIVDSNSSQVNELAEEYKQLQQQIEEMSSRRDFTDFWGNVVRDAEGNVRQISDQGMVLQEVLSNIKRDLNAANGASSSVMNSVISGIIGQIDSSISGYSPVITPDNATVNNDVEQDQRTYDSGIDTKTEIHYHVHTGVAIASESELREFARMLSEMQGEEEGRNK